MALPDLQLAVSEQRIRSWAAAAAQLQVQVTIFNPAAAGADAGTKKPTPASAAGAAAGVKGSGAAAAAAAAAVAAATVASGTLVVNCAGLLTGDSSATYSWGKPMPPALAAHAQEVAGSTPPFAADLDTTAHAPAAAADAVSAPSAQQGTPADAAAAQHKQRFKWSVQPPSGALQDWLESAEVELKVCLRGQQAVRQQC